VAEGAPPGGPDRGPGAGTIAVVALSTCAAYATSFLGTWQHDDFRAIVEDPRVQSLGAWWASMPGIRPLLKLSYALNVQGGLGLPGFHAVNLAVHAAAAILALLLLDRLGRRLASPPPPWTAALGALLFALHPVQTEAVTYLSGRSASLSGALALASAWTFLLGRDRGDRRLSLLLSPALLAASLAVKELAVVMPAALLLLEAVDRRGFAWRRSLAAVAVHLAVVAAGAAAYLAAPAYRGMLGESLALRGPGWNVLTQARAVAWLVGQLVPLGGLAAEPDLRPVTAWGPGAAPAIAALLAVLAAAVGGLLLLRRRPLPALAALWALLWLAPQGWWLPRPEPASDRQLYLALLGPAWLAGALLVRLPGPRLWRPAATAALVSLLAGATAQRSLVYRDEVTFWSDAVRKAPASARARGNLGYALALACRPEEARAAFQAATALDPANPRPQVNLALLERGELLSGEAARRCAGATRPR
jgi:protein O-mannosyl-transferase